MLNHRVYNRITAALFVVLLSYIGIMPVLVLAPVTVSASTITGTLNAGVTRAGSMPTELVIPAIGADVPVIPLGVTSTGNMAVPNNFTQAAWYRYGPVPGTQGSAVIAAHVDNGGYSPTVNGVFKHLNDLTIGDTMTVRLSDGSAATFRVTAMNVYGYNSFPSQTVFGQNDNAYLKIITCHGTWLPTADTYSQRLVVTAVRIA